MFLSGISLLGKSHADVTHHLTPTCSLTATIAASLIAKAHLVKPEWLSALISSGNSTDATSNLEWECTLPSVSKFRPGLSPSLSSSLKNHRIWEPNEARATLLNDYRVVFVGERGREAKDEFKDLVRLGGATYECCPAQGGIKALHSVLAKAESKGKQPALVADEQAMVAALGQDGWNELVAEAAKYALSIVDLDNLAKRRTTQLRTSLHFC